MYHACARLVIMGGHWAIQVNNDTPLERKRFWILTLWISKDQAKKAIKLIKFCASRETLKGDGMLTDHLHRTLNIPGQFHMKSPL